METHAAKLLWLQVPPTFRGVPDELLVKVRRRGGGACCCLPSWRRYRTCLRVRLEARHWSLENDRLRHRFAPPLIFPVPQEELRLKVRVRDQRTRASWTYKIGGECLGAVDYLPDICLLIFPNESSKNMCVSEEGLARPFDTCFSATEAEASQDSSGVLQDSVSHSEERSCGTSHSVVHEENPLMDGALNESHPNNPPGDPVGVLVSPSGSMKGIRHRTAGREHRRAPFPTTRQILEMVHATQERVTFPDLSRDQQDMNEDIVQSVLQFRYDKQQMLARKTYNSNIYYVRLEKRIMEIFISLYFAVLSFLTGTTRELRRLYEGVKHLRVLQIYTRVAEKITYGHEQVTTQVKLEQRILRLINLLRLKLRHVRRLGGLRRGGARRRVDIGRALARGRGALLAFMFNHVTKTAFWLVVSTALSVLYLFMNYRVAGEVKQQVLVFVTLLLVIFSVCSNFKLGRVYIIIATLQIVVKFTSKTHLLFILTEMVRLQLIVLENLRRVGQATTCYRKLYKTILEHIIERERQKRAEMLTLILDFISRTRERMAQALRAVFLHAQFIHRTFQTIKDNYKTIGLLELMCKVVVPTLQNYCGASVSEVKKDCKSKVGVLSYLGVCHLIEAVRQSVCGIFFHPFNFLCNFDDVVMKFLNEALDEIGLKEMYQQLREEFMMEVDIEYRFNHTVYTGGSSDERDKSEVFDHIAKYFPGGSSSDLLFLLLYYLFMVMAFLKPLFDLWSFKRNLSFRNDCVDSKTFKNLDSKAPRRERILPLDKDDIMYFREHIYSLPGSTSKRFLLLFSVYWTSAAAFCLTLIASFFSTLISFDLSFVSFLDLTELSPESKGQLKEARRAAKNYTLPGIFSKSAEDFYRKMNKFKEDHVAGAMNFKGYAKKHKSCAPAMLTADAQLLRKLYTWTAIIFLCNSIGLALRLTYGRLLEHFFPEYKVPRARDLRERIEQQRVLTAARRRQLQELLGRADYHQDRTFEWTRDKTREEEEEGKEDQDKSEEKTDQDKSLEEEQSASDRDEDTVPAAGRGARGGASVPAAKDAEVKTSFMEKLLSFICKLVPNFQPFFLEKFVCTACGKETSYKHLQECVQPTCGAVLCSACAHGCQERRGGKCPDCGFPFVMDTYLEFPVQPSPTRSLYEEDLEPLYIDPEVRYKWMKPLTLCTACGKHFVLNYLQQRCMLCRSGGIQEFDPKKYEAATPRPRQPRRQVHMPGFDFLVAGDPAQDLHADIH